MTENAPDAMPREREALRRLYDLHINETIGDDDPEWTAALDCARDVLATPTPPGGGDAAAMRDALDAIMPGILCGEDWGLPDTQKVAITVTLGALRRARAALAATPPPEPPAADAVAEALGDLLISIDESDKIRDSQPHFERALVYTHSVAVQNARAALAAATSTPAADAAAGMPDVWQAERDLINDGWEAVNSTLNKKSTMGDMQRALVQALYGLEAARAALGGTQPQETGR